MSQLNNPYIPQIARVLDVIDETSDIKTIALRLQQPITFTPGQFVMVTVYGFGEAPFAIASKPGKTDTIEITVRSIGDVTRAIHRLKKDDIVGIRGPLGRGFPLNELENNNIVVIAGGTGLIGVVSLLWYIHVNRSKFKDVTLLFGVRTPRDFIRVKDLEEFRKSIEIHLSVDRAEGMEWHGHVGFVTDFIDLLDIVKPNTKYIVCGPPMMMKVAFKKLVSKGVDRRDIYVSLERHMKCGIGKCGRCMLSNGMYVCRDGPVFRCDTIPERDIE